MILYMESIILCYFNGLVTVSFSKSFCDSCVQFTRPTYEEKQLLPHLLGSCQSVENTGTGSLCWLSAPFSTQECVWRKISSPICFACWQLSHSWFLAITCSCSIGFCSLVTGIHGLSVHPVMTSVISAKCKSWHGCLSFMICILTLIQINLRSPNIKGSNS